MSELWDVPTGGLLEESKTTIRNLPRASAKAIQKARGTWPEAKSDDFEREGKLFRDKATDTLYRRVPGDPQARRDSTRGHLYVVHLG